MIVSRIPGCCSMVSISDNPAPGTGKVNFLTNFKTLLDSAEISLHGVKAVIMITNEDWKNRLRYRNIGFKRVSSYDGQGKTRAHILIIKFPKGFENYFNKI